MHIGDDAYKVDFLNRSIADTTDKGVLLTTDNTIFLRREHFYELHKVNVMTSDCQTRPDATEKKAGWFKVRLEKNRTIGFIYDCPSWPKDTSRSSAWIPRGPETQSFGTRGVPTERAILIGQRFGFCAT
jgi:hypothetical protein